MTAWKDAGLPGRSNGRPDWRLLWRVPRHTLQLPALPSLHEWPLVFGTARLPVCLGRRSKCSAHCTLQTPGGPHTCSMV